MLLRRHDPARSGSGVMAKRIRHSAPLGNQVSCVLSHAVPGQTFYVSNHLSADDRNDGLKPTSAWRTIRRVNANAYGVGDAILFRGGATFRGTITFDRDDRGTPRRPIRVGSFGKGRATILALAGSGLTARNTAAIEVRDLIFRGSGLTRNRGSGISFENSLHGDTKLAHVRIERVEIHGFGHFGITIGGRRGASGFRDVRIACADVHHNRIGGIEMHGRFSAKGTDYANEDVYIGHCTVHDHPGYARSCRHVGDGIVLAHLNGGVIEHCVSWNNGALNTCKDGPVGIWVWDANAVTIQHCESHHNRTAGRTDGGGFDLDGGATNCIVQHNYSHDNDGAGFGIYQFRVARPMRGNIIRHNVSVNDGRRNGYAGIQLKNWGSGIRETQIHDNVVIMHPPSISTRLLPSAIQISSETEGVAFLRNLLVVAGGLPLLRIRGRQHRLVFAENKCHVVRGRFRIQHSGRTHNTVESWLASCATP
jgi:hypothetical protein